MFQIECSFIQYVDWPWVKEPWPSFSAGLSVAHLGEGGWRRRCCRHLLRSAQSGRHGYSRCAASVRTGCRGHWEPSRPAWRWGCCLQAAEGKPWWSLSACHKAAAACWSYTAKHQEGNIIRLFLICVDEVQYVLSFLLRFGFNKLL